MRKKRVEFKRKKCKNTNQEPIPEVLTHIVNLLNRVEFILVLLCKSINYFF